MVKFDHLRIPVGDLRRSREWYIRTLGLTVEFEVPDRETVALQDTEGFTIFLQEVRSPVAPNGPRAGSSSPMVRASPTGGMGRSSSTPTDT